MERLEEVLNQNVACDCGKNHFVPIEQVVVDSSVTEHLAAYLRTKGFQKILLAADEITFNVLGEQVYEYLSGKTKLLQKIVFPAHDLLPDEGNVEVLRRMIRAEEYDAVLAVGSGVINDLVRYTTFEADLPYISIATAPSMDGYASNMAAMQFSGLKLTSPAHTPIAIFADLSVLSEAPFELIQSGFGDLAGKVISLSDWILGSKLFGEYFCEKTFKLVYEPLTYVIENADYLAKRDPEAVKNLFYGLIDSGIAMAMAGNSRPASGSEHHCSHYWDWCAYLGKRHHMSHGLQVGVATGWMSQFYHRFFCLKAVVQPSVPEVGDEFRKYAQSFYKSGADNIVRVQQEKENMLRTHTSAVSSIDIQKLHQQFESVRKLLEGTREALDTMRIPRDTREIEVDLELLRETFLHAKELRPRYTIFDFLEGQGILESVANNILAATSF